MAEHASTPDLQATQGTSRLDRYRTPSTVAETPHRPAAPTVRGGATDPRTQEELSGTTIDRLAFYFFMTSVGLGILGMIASALFM